MQSLEVEKHLMCSRNGREVERLMEELERGRSSSRAGGTGSPRVLLDTLRNVTVAL